jgi:hypothetical protein
MQPPNDARLPDDPIQWMSSLRDSLPESALHVRLFEEFEQSLTHLFALHELVAKVERLRARYFTPELRQIIPQQQPQSVQFVVAQV